MNGQTQQQQQPPMGRNFRILLWLALLWLAIGLIMRGFSFNPPLEISYTGFKKKVKQGGVAEVTLRGEEVTGRFKEPVKRGPEGEKREYERFKTVVPSIEDPELLGLLEKENVVINVESDTRAWYELLLVNLLPWVILIALFYYGTKKLQERMRGGGGGPFGFGKSKAKIYTKSSSEVGFGDVAGLGNVKRELREIIEFLKDPERYQRLGGELPRGVLLVGPPGTGKTLLARAAAGEAEVPFFSISGSEFIEMLVGVGASRVRDMFDKAKEESPAIIFIDEIDSIGRVRGTGLGGGHDEREQTLNQILAEMDGFSAHESVVVLAATNRPDVLDPALVRPGRFDRRVTLELPHRKARREILETHAREVPLAEGVDLDSIAARTVGFSGADLKNLVNEAALIAGRAGKEEVDAEDLEKGRDKIILGLEREEIINDEDREYIAYHEAGHALMARLLPGADPLERVTIIPRGRALGATEQLPEEDRHNLTRTFMLNRIAILLGGRAAERIRFEDVTSGGGDDLKKATQLARKMVCQLGMSDKLGPVTFRHGEDHPFLGREMAEPKDFSEDTARVIDEEIRRIVGEMAQKAENALEENKESLEALAGALLEHETLDKDEIDELLGPVEEGPRERDTA